MTIKVLIADDQALVRSGFRMILEARDDLEVKVDRDLWKQLDVGDRLTKQGGEKPRRS